VPVETSDDDWTPVNSDLANALQQVAGSDAKSETLLLATQWCCHDTMSAELDQIAFRFFKLFAQYEYALKAMGFGSAGSNGQAEPAWDQFANEVGIKIMTVTDEPVAAARCYILEQPPKRQVWVGGAAAWEPVANNDKSVQTLFGHIRRVRNNLYHGGKFNGRWIDPDRSRELIDKSILILVTLLELDDRLREAIHGNAD
jgi:hypothetical protein